MEQQPSKVTLRANTKKLLQTLKQVYRAVGKRSARTVVITSEITVANDKITIAVPGAIFSLECITSGTCKASVPFLHFLKVVKNSKAVETEITITEGRITLNSVTLLGKTTFFENDTILRTIDLPINYIEGGLICLSANDYTYEEIEFNNLKPKIDKVLDNLDANINKTYLILKKYGVKSEHLEQITKKRLFAENLKPVKDATFS